MHVKHMAPCGRVETYIVCTAPLEVQAADLGFSVARGTQKMAQQGVE